MRSEKSTEPTPVEASLRQDDIAHFREQIAADPEAYANEGKLGVVAERMLNDVLGGL